VQKMGKISECGIHDSMTEEDLVRGGGRWPRGAKSVLGKPGLAPLLIAGSRATRDAINYACMII